MADSVVPERDFHSIDVKGMVATCVTHTGRTVVLTLQHLSYD